MIMLTARHKTALSASVLICTSPVCRRIKRQPHYEEMNKVLNRQKKLSKRYMNTDLFVLKQIGKCVSWGSF